jgi:hypothetical protein
MQTKTDGSRTVPDVADLERKDYKDANATIYSGTTDKGNLFAMGFLGTSKKRKFAYAFTTEEKRQEHINQWIERLESNRKALNERKERAEAEAVEFAKTLKVGDIFHCGWGYSMTLNDFYQVVEITKSRKSVKVRKLKKFMTASDSYGQSGMQSCTKDDFATDKISTHRIQDGSIKINDYAWARLWDGTPQTYNSYD